MKLWWKATCGYKINEVQKVKYKNKSTVLSLFKSVWHLESEES